MATQANVRNGTDRRGNERGNGRRSDNPDLFALCRLHLANVERINELLTFPNNGWILATEADKRRETAAQLSECNRFLMTLIAPGN
jgi:hypothetical protein